MEQVKSLGPTTKQMSGLWLICAGALPSASPTYGGRIWENFGRTNSYVDAGFPIIALTNAHLYNVMASPTLRFNRLNNQPQYSTNNNTGWLDTPALPRFGWGTAGLVQNGFRGYISEVLMFNRQLTEA